VWTVEFLRAAAEERKSLPLDIRAKLRRFIEAALRQTQCGSQKSEGGQMSTTVLASDIHAEDMLDPAYRAAYEALEPEFALIETMMAARARAKLTQAAIAERMGTTESAVSRLESGRTRPSTRTLERYAAATGHRLKITMEPL
jgi:DNA-binding transcriptional regulator YiaG